ncbi:MAG: threonylcarbamoyl-AMP synthase [Bacilli bacterium]|nr:threonylcarbamoyl-AMP synthase [Bacilli bacterium]
MIVNLNTILQSKITDEVIIFETDTVYGIGCLLSSEKGVKKIYDIKSREQKNPLAVLCANISQVKELVVDFEKGSELAKKHWPGALTLVFEKQSCVGDFITSGFNTVGVRIPKNDTALAILNHFGPMAVTSLNISKEPAILNFKDTLEYDAVVDFIVEGKDLDSLSSTVYDVINNRVLRQGKIKLD